MIQQCYHNNKIEDKPLMVCNFVLPKKEEERKLVRTYHCY